MSVFWFERKFLVEEGGTLPRGFDVAWWLHDRDAAVVLPIPFNFIAGWIRYAYIEVRRKLRPAADSLVRERIRAIAESQLQATLNRQAELLAELNASRYDDRVRAFEAGYEGAHAITDMQINGATPEQCRKVGQEIREKALGSRIILSAGRLP